MQLSSDENEQVIKKKQEKAQVAMSKDSYTQILERINELQLINFG